MGIKFSNNADTTLADSLTDSEYIIALASGGGADFPTVNPLTDYFYITLVNQAGTREVIKVQFRNTDTLGSETYKCTRGVDGSSAVPWDKADCKVQLRIPSIALEDIVDDIDTNATAIEGLVGFLEAPAGLEMYFYENVAPTGWTINSGPADSLLSVKGGSEDYNVTGGQTAGSWTPTPHYHDESTHVHSIGAHSHTINAHNHEVSAHNHKWYNFDNTANHNSFDNNGSAETIEYTFNQTQTAIMSTDTYADNKLGEDYYTDNEAANDTSTGGPTSTYSEDLGDSDPNGPSVTADSSAPASDRPKAAVGIIATKD